MKNIINELIDMVVDLQKKLNEKEDDLNKLINYLANKGIYITVHGEYLSSELDKENK